MTSILVETLADARDGSRVLDATITATATRPRAVGPKLTLPEPVTVRLRRGQLERPLILAEPDGTWAWTISVRPTGAPLRRAMTGTYRFSGAEVAWADLEPVDPRTLIPLSPVPPNVQQILDLATTKAEAAETAAENAAAAQASSAGYAGSASQSAEAAMEAALDAAATSETIVNDALTDYTEALGQFEIQPMNARGHSWVGSNNYATTNARVHERVARRLLMGTITNKGVSGRTIGDISNLALGGADVWTPRTRALVLAVCTINDVTLFDGSAASRRGYVHAWRAMLSVLTANEAVAANTAQFAYSPGWTAESVAGTQASPQGATQNSTGGTRWKTTTTGRYVDIAFAGPSVDVHLVARAAGAGLATFTIGGTTLGTLDLTAATAQDCNAVFRVRGQGSGAHVLRVTLTSGASLTVDSIRIPLSAPAPILVLGEPTIIPTGSDHSTYLADVETFKADLAAIVAEFPSAVYLDLNQPGWDPSSMLSADGKHPNDKGAAFLASRCIDKLATVPYQTGLNTLAPSYPAAYTPPANPTVPAGGNDGTGSLPVSTTVDTFNRADADTLGTTSDGAKTWRLVGATPVFGIRSNQAAIVSVASGRAFAVIDQGSGDATMKVTVADIGSAPTNTAIVFRVQDIDNYLSVARFSGSDNRYNLTSRIAGTQSNRATAATAQWTNGDVLEVTLVGPNVVLEVNGEVIITTSISSLLTAGAHGIYGATTSTAARFDQFELTA